MHVDILLSFDLSLPTLTLKIQIPVSVLREIPKIIIEVKNIPT